jgi:subtilisin family serine protease
MAVSKGMLVFSSAGNEGSNPWQKIISPADGDSVIAVAAVNREGIRAAFSSMGPAPDGALKPDLAAMGQQTALQGANGLVTAMNGTSFSSPLLAGMAACLWQAFPGATASQVRQAFIRSGRMFHRPDTLLGHGIPDMRIAFALLAGSQDLKKAETRYWTLFPNPTEGGFTLLSETGFSGATTVEIYASSGALQRKAGFSGPGPHRIALPGNGTSGLWLLRIISPLGTEVAKVTGVTGK